MALFERTAHGINLDFCKDLEGVIGSSDKTEGLVATERPLQLMSEDTSHRVHISEEQIPEGAVTYSAGIPVRYDGKTFMPITFYRKR